MCKPYNVTKRWLHTYRHSDRIDSDWMYANAKWIAILWLQLFQFVSFFLICRFASLFINNIHTWKPSKFLPCFISKCQLHGNTCVKIIKKKIGEARKIAPEHCVEFQSNSFFRFRCCHYTSICKYADILWANPIGTGFQC